MAKLHCRLKWRRKHVPRSNPACSFPSREHLSRAASRTSDKSADVRMKCTCTCAPRLHSLFTFVYEMPGNHRCFPYPALSVLTVKPTVPKAPPWDPVLNSDPSIFAGIHSSLAYMTSSVLQIKCDIHKMSIKMFCDTFPFYFLLDFCHFAHGKKRMFFF